MAASSHGRCGAGSAARPVFSSAHLARLFWDSFFAGSSRVALVVSNPPGERPPISVLFALRTGVACRGQLLRQPPRREYARCSGLPYGVQRWIAPNVGVEVLCEAEGLRFTKVPGNPADAVGGRQTGYILTAIPEEAINSKWAVFVDRSTNCRTLIIKRIGDWVQVPLQDSTAEEIVGIDTALVPLPENAYCRVVFNKMVDDEALLILSGETIEITLLDVELTHKSKIVVAVGAPVTVCNLDPMFADGDSLVTRKKNGDVVFILSEWKDFCLDSVGLVAVDAKTGNVVHLTGRCSSLTQRVFRNVSDNHARKFHACCDQRGPTLIIAKSVNGYVFGGYTAQDWDGSLSSFVADTTGTSFYYLLGISHGPCFGAGNDLWIAHNCFSSPSASSILLRTYGLPHPVPQEFDTIRDTLDVDSWLGGAPKFQLTEYEVYIVMS